MATGDLLAASVAANGWQLLLTFEGLGTGGTYDLGLGANNSIGGSEKVTLNLTSEGYDDVPTLTTGARTVYGTKEVRKPDPNDATNDEDANGGNVIVKLALSDAVFADDAAITLDLAAGLYNDGGNASNAATGFSVTNNATATYAKVKSVANWSCVPRQLIQADSFKLRVVAFQHFGQAQRPVGAVKFEVSDEHANTVTETILVPTVEPTEYSDSGPAIQEYIATIDTTGFTDGDTLTANFTAYPWVGDANAINTSVGGPAQPTPRPAPITYKLDRAGTYEGRVAVVDSSGGNDGTGATVARGAFDSGAPPNAYQTINAALVALKADMTRGDLGNCVVYLRDNAPHSFLVTNAGVLADVRSTYLHFDTFPLDTQAQINAGGGSDSAGDGQPHRFGNIKLTLPTNTFTAMDWLWLDQSEWDESGFASLRSSDLVFCTNVLHTRHQNSTGGFGGYSTDITQVALCRSPRITSGALKGFLRPYVFLGAHTISRVSSTFTIGPGTVNHQNLCASLDGCWIRAFNDVRVEDGGQVFELSTNPGANLNGLALVGNVLERTSAASLAASVDSSGMTTGQELSNIVYWHNTFADWKHNVFYNDTPGVAPTFGYLSCKGNIFADWNTKSDTFANDGGNVNNWMVVFGVGFRGNLFAERPNSGAPQDFNLEFHGLDTDSSGDTAEIDPTYVNDQSIAVGGTGMGDYRAKAPEANASVTLELLPYDLYGNPRPTDGTEFFGALLPVPDPPTSLSQS